mmetsp:Transcript_7848/g.18835  ORF Transcript_7848/g.18835 Transcript_7848/m.18835 type:complete len:243 (-) Transcript_7848:12-740(-)
MAAPLVPKPKQQGMFDYGTLASVEKCTSEELAEKWLGKLDLKDAKHVKQAFQEHGVIGTDVVYLDLSDLQVLCDKVGDRKKILRSLHELKNAKVMQEKNRIIGKFYPWEPWGCCCLCRNRDVPVIVLPTVIKFKTRPSLKFPSVESCISRERITESVFVSQIQDMTVRQTGWSLCDFDIARMCCWCPTTQLHLVADNETNPELTFMLPYSEAAVVEQMLRDAMEASASGQTDMAYILADKRS